MWDIFRQGLEDRSAEMVVMGPERKSGACLTADGSWQLYWTLSDRQGSRLMRIASAGSPQLVLVPRGEARVRCPSVPGKSCVLSEADAVQLHFSLLDPVRGRGAEIARIDRNAFSSDTDWDLSPDGSNAVFIVKGRIEILALAGGTKRDVSVEGWTRFDTVVWSADGGGLFASSVSPRAALLRVDLDGHARVLWERGVKSIVPSPDGSRLALAGQTTDSNAWKIENF